MAACTTRVAVAALAGLLLPQAAGAVEGCHGTYSAGVYAPLPASAVVAVDASHSSSVDPTVLAAFNNGLTQSGVATKGTPGILLVLSYNVFNQSSGPGTAMGAMTQSMTGGNSGWTTAPTAESGNTFGSGQSNSGLSGLGGGPDLQMPGLPKVGSFTFNAPPPTPPVLFLRVQAKAAGSPAAAWVANLQCKVTTTDTEDLAYQLGNFIGGIIGQRVTNGPM